jgi:phage shock protein PspC (stress-responsive transcriptional regulator)
MERPQADRFLGGVCAAISNSLGINVTVVRFGTVLTAVFGPGVLIYLVLCWAIPAEPR